MNGRFVRSLTFVLSFAVLPAIAQAQALGSIAGVVKDTTGAVLPGVTVEAASPALIEKTRTVVTDESGQYKVVDVRPGVYAITFSLSGFSTVHREGLNVSPSFTAVENAEMRVGSVEETVTVSGASPVVDIQNVQSQRLLTRELLDTVPNARFVASFEALTLGAVVSGAGILMHDVGGIKGDDHAALQIYDSRPQDTKTLLDGLRIETAGGPSGGIYSNFRINQLNTDEVVLQTSGMGAEAQTGGVQMNVVLKDGGNTFRGVTSGAYTNTNLQSSNLTPELIGRGITSTPNVKSIYDIGLGLGGPIKKDALWFYTGNRWWGSSYYMPGAYFNATQDTVFYTPDLNRPGYRNNPDADNSIRLTWQAAEQHKLTFFVMYQRACNCYRETASNRAPESTESVTFAVPTVQATWNHPASNRWLLQAGVNYIYDNRWNARPPENSVNNIQVTEQSTGLVYGSMITASQIGYGYVKGDHTAARFSAAYVTGSHAFKTGVNFYLGRLWHYAEAPNPPLAYTFLNQKPVGVTTYALPQQDRDGVLDTGWFAQDQWTMRKLTLNMGLRLDTLYGWVPAQTRPAGPFVSAFSFPSMGDVPNWKDLSPRLGAAYDLFGNGKTAIKGSIGRYVIGLGTGLADAINPANAIVTSASRSWIDVNGNYSPDCNFLNSAANGECGPLSPSTFGTVAVATHYAPEVLNGFNVRPYMWSAQASFQQELRSNVLLNAAYSRTWYGNFTATQNLENTPADYDPYCINAPHDPGLPSGGGYTICGLYDIRANVFGKVNNLVQNVSNFGTQTEVYNGAEVSVTARLGRGALLSGGVSSGQTTFNNCVVVNSPQLQFCNYSLPFRGQTQVKWQAAYPLPWDLSASAVFQNLPGIPILSTQSVPNAQIAPSLGRNLSSCPTPTGPCTATALVTLLEPNTQFEGRLNQIDVRLTKTLRFGPRRFQGMFDVYNLLNASTILSEVSTYGPTWKRPTEILAGRLVKFSFQFDF
jgi:hypothetical protein